VSKPDFSKLWGSNGSVDSISDDDFLKGFAYLGDNPPTVEEFNWLFQQLCTKLQWLDENLLPLAGGTVTGAVNGVTADQFDATAKLATTAFVQRALGNKQLSVIYTASKTLTVSQLGAFVEYAGTATATIILPTAVGYGGGTFEIWNNSSYTLTLSSSSGEFIGPSAGTGSGTTTTTILPGDSVVLVSDAYNWICTSGGGLASIGTNGYQKLPSGLIFQWGFLSKYAASSAQATWTATLPLTFPTALISAYANLTNGAVAGLSQTTIADTGTPSGGTNALPVSAASSISGVIYNGTSQNITFGIRYFAIGY
jgi:hypothetical protein